jgi:hypothetical protein
MRIKPVFSTPARRRALPAVVALAVAVAAGSSLPAYPASDQVTSADVFWIWDPTAATGTSTLIRTDSGISASLRTSELPPGTANTLWFVVFNNPSACATRPCLAPDLFNPAVQGDFLYGGGNIVGGSGSSGFGGHLPVGDNSGSGHLEIGTGGLAVGLLDPRGAEVHLLVHSHGPAMTGQTLKAQISSFLGGCQVFLGNAYGIAQEPEDVPLAEGECSTIQASVYMP